MKRKAVLLAALCAAVILAAGWLYQSSHPVEDDLSNLEECVLEFYNHGRQLPLKPDINVYDALKFGDRQYVLLEIGEDLGRAELEQGLMGRWKLTRLSYGGGNFREEVVEYEGEKYLLFGGRNTGCWIAAVEVDAAGTTTRLELPASDRFFLCTKLQSFVETDHALPEAFRFYDAAGADITDLVDWNGMGNGAWGGTIS